MFKKVVCIVLCLIKYHVTTTTFRFRCGLWPAALLSWSDCPAFRGGVHLQPARPEHRQDTQCWAQLHIPAAAAAIGPSFKVSANHNVEEIKILCVCVWFYCSRQSLHRQEADIFEWFLLRKMTALAWNAGQKIPWIKSPGSQRMHQCPLFCSIYLFIHFLTGNLFFKQPLCWLSSLAFAFVRLCLTTLLLYNGKFAECHLHPRCPSSKTDPQRLAALHFLLVYMGNDPKLELKVTAEGGTGRENRRVGASAAIFFVT